MELPKIKPSAEEIDRKLLKEMDDKNTKIIKLELLHTLKTVVLREKAAIAGIVGNIDVETGGSFDYTQKQTKSGDPRSSDSKRRWIWFVSKF